MRSRNFTLEEIAHRPLPKDKREIAAFQMGSLQRIVDYLSYQLRVPVGCTVLSGLRLPEINANTPGASPTSNHIWRLEDEHIRSAGDYRFFNKITKVRIPCSIVYPLLAPFGGEIYWNTKEDLIHISDQKENEPHFIK